MNCALKAELAMLPNRSAAPCSLPACNCVILMRTDSLNSKSANAGRNFSDVIVRAVPKIRTGRASIWTHCVAAASRMLRTGMPIPPTMLSKPMVRGIAGNDGDFGAANLQVLEHCVMVFVKPRPGRFLTIDAEAGNCFVQIQRFDNPLRHRGWAFEISIDIPLFSPATNLRILPPTRPSKSDGRALVCLIMRESQFHWPELAR